MLELCRKHASSSCLHIPSLVELAMSDLFVLYLFVQTAKAYWLVGSPAVRLL